MHASLAAELGGRQVDRHVLLPPRRFAERVPEGTGCIGRCKPNSAYCGLDRVGHLDEAVLHAELVRQELAEAADAEALRGVMAGRDEVSAALARVSHYVLSRLAGEERVEAPRDRLVEHGVGRSGHDADALDELRPRVPRERLLPERLRAAAPELL